MYEILRGEKCLRIKILNLERDEFTILHRKKSGRGVERREVEKVLLTPYEDTKLEILIVNAKCKLQNMKC